MFKVVIVDDEALVRVGLRSMIHWEEQNCELVGEAANGQIGYELIVSIRPDIVITDLKMPVMDGLEMIQKLSSENIKTKFIVLSGYNDFDLVRKVMKYGIEDYIIKLELEPELLINVLTRITEELIFNHKQEDENFRKERYIRSSQYNLREEFFKKLVTKIIKDDDAIREEMDYLQIQINEDNIVCVGIQIHHHSDFSNYEEQDTNLLEFSILGIVEEIVKDFFTGYCIKWSSKEYLIILSYESRLDEGVVRQSLEDMGQRIATMLKQYFNTNVVVAVSNVNKNLNGISSACFESLKALKQSFYNSTEKVIFYDELYKTEEAKAVVRLKNIEDLIKNIENNDLTSIEAVFENIVTYLESGKPSKEKAYDICAKIAYTITMAIGEDENSIQMVFGDNKSIFEKIIKLSSIKETIQWVRSIEKGVFYFLLNKDKIHNNKIITTAKKYVNENIYRTINLNEIAAILNISSGYFSTIFKQIAGINFIDYVTEVKIEKAKELLKETNYKIYEIAQMTGYENAYYFSKVFKKVTGSTPKEYINKNI